ncbi:succinate dehydrogenase, hydrophobic membrane anchor protein [Novosphingobium sp.]|uniref:succinate dehydrogenase, hydrophobic membrane anchor protein n=1 Tax=Novosphingobium sp. TaxID=1874826 RepID=UPI003B516B6C
MGNGTSIGRVRGLGSSHRGAHHFLAKRLTGIGNLVLIPYLMISLALLNSYDYATVHAWLAQPVAATAMVLILLNTVYHARLGVQEMLEDYVHGEGGRIASWLLINFVPVAASAFGIVCVIRIALGGA